MQIQSLRTKKGIVFFLAGMLAIHAAVWWRARAWIKDGSADFTSMYTAGKMVREGKRTEIFDEKAEWDTQRQFAKAAILRKKSWPYVHAPFEAVLFVPFGSFPYMTAYFLFIAANTVMVALVYVLLKRHFPILTQYSVLAWIAVVFCYFPAFFTILEGQDSLVLLLLYGLVLVAMKKNSWFIAGIWLALGLFRFHLVLPFVLIMFLIKKWRLLAGFILGGAVVAGWSAVVVGWRGVWAYPGYLWWLENHGGKQILSPAANCNLRGLVDWMLDGRLSDSAINGIIACISVLAIGFAVTQWRKAEESDAAGLEFAFSISLIVSILVSYHGFMYDLTLLLIPIVVVVSRCLGKDRHEVPWNLIWPIAVLFFSPLYLIFSLGQIHHRLMAVVMVVWAWAISREIHTGQPAFAVQTTAQV